MFGRSTMDPYGDDPFFGMHQNHMRMMQGMFNTPMMRDPFMALTDGTQQAPPRHQHQEPNQQRAVAMDPFGGMGMFGHMNSMMSSMMGNMNRMMRDVESSATRAQNDPNSNFYSQSTVMSFNNTGGGQPQVYQATTSTRQAGGVKETRKSVRDSTTGTEKMAIGRHIGDRGHVVQKSRNHRTGDIEEEKELINMDEADEQDFSREFQERTRSHRRGAGITRPEIRHRALTDGRSSCRSPYERPPAPPAAEGSSPTRRQDHHHQNHHTTHTSRHHGDVNTRRSHEHSSHRASQHGQRPQQPPHMPHLSSQYRQ